MSGAAPCSGNALMGLYLALGIMIPIRLGTVAILQLMVASGLVNTLTALILVYTAQGLPLAIFILAEFMKSVSDDLKNAGRIDGLERQVASFSERLAEQAEQPGVALAIAASALKAAIDRGTPFMSELETYAAIAPDSPEVAALRDMAAAGVPTRAAIEAQMPAAATAMIAAGRPVDAQAGIVDRLLSSAQSLVAVRPVGMAEGSDAPAIVARMETLLRNGDLAGALAEYDTLPPAAKAAGADLAAQIRARHSADEIVGRALAAALRA